MKPVNGYRRSMAMALIVANVFRAVVGDGAVLRYMRLTGISGPVAFKWRNNYIAGDPKAR